MLSLYFLFHKILPYTKDKTYNCCNCGFLRCIVDSFMPHTLFNSISLAYNEGLLFGILSLHIREIVLHSIKNIQKPNTQHTIQHTQPQILPYV